MQTNEQILKDGILEALELLKEYGKAVLMQQGHVATRDGINSLETQIDTLGNEFIGSVTGRKYLLAQDTGIKSFPNKTGGHIEAIMRWIETKKITWDIQKSGGKPLSPSKKTVKNMAFLIVRKHGIEGMHTTGGVRDLSKQGWIGQTIDAKKQEVFDIISNSGYKYFNSMIKSMVDESKRNNQ